MMIEYIERFVSAVEKFADAQTRNANANEKYVAYLIGRDAAPDTDDDDAETEPAPATKEPTPAAKEPEPGAEADSLPYASLDRDQLVLLCEQRGMEVEPRVRNSTLVKRLENYDLVQEAGGPAAPPPEPEQEPASEPAPDFDPLDEQPEEPQLEEVTLEQLRDKLVALRDAKGKDALMSLLNAHGAASLRDVPEDKYATLFSKASAQIKG